MIDEPLYEKHQNAITTSQHTEISVEYAIEALQKIEQECIAYIHIGGREPNLTLDVAKKTWKATKWSFVIQNKISDLKALLK